MFLNGLKITITHLHVVLVEKYSSFHCQLEYTLQLNEIDETLKWDSCVIFSSWDGSGKNTICRTWFYPVKSF